MIKKDEGRMRELILPSTTLQTIKMIVNTCLRIVSYYLKSYPLSYLKIRTCLTFRFSKFRFPSSLRKGILWNAKVHTNHLDIKEREV